MPINVLPDWKFNDRDVLILREISKNPQISSRRLTEVLEEEYDIDVSCVTVSESIRKMRQQGVFREAIIPNEEYFIFGLFEFKCTPEIFEENWHDATEFICDDPHTLFYFFSDGEYQWKSVMMFPHREAESQWIHEFYKKYGDVIDNIRNSVIYNVLKFQVDPELLNDLLKHRK